MRLAHFAGAAVLAAALAPFSAYSQTTWSVIVPESEITTVSGGATTSLNALASAGSGLFFCGNLNPSSVRSILRIDTTQAAGSRVTSVATDSALVAAIAAVNGTAADPAASAVRFQAMGVNSNGQLIVFLDGSAMTAALLSIAPTAPHTITVLSCQIDAGTSPVEGGNGMTVVGNTAYLLVDRSFGAAEDAVIAVDTTLPITTQGTRTATTVIGETALLAASGDTEANQSLNDIKFRNATTAIIVNSGASGSNDDVLQLTLGTPNTVTKLVAATALETAITATDVGYSSLAVEPGGELLLSNMFGAGATDDSVLVLNNFINSTTFTVAGTDTEPELVGWLGGTDFFIGADGLVYDSGSNKYWAVSDGTGNSGLISINAASASVNDWTLL